VSSIEPYRIEDALRVPDLVLTMQEELNNFTRNEVWHLVPRPNQNVVGTKLVFRNKQDEHGVVTRNKAQLVAKGYSQVEGLCRRGNSPARWRNAPALNPKMRRRGLSVLPARWIRNEHKNTQGFCRGP
jgi:hypothetical protein